MRRAALAAAVLAIGAVVAPGAGPAEAACRAGVSSLTLRQTTVDAGDSVRATVRLRCRARAQVSVRVRGTEGIVAPRVIRVAKGSRVARFTVRTRVAYVPRRLRIVATWRGTRRTARLVVRPACKPAPLAVVVPTLYAGDQARATVRLSCAARAATTVVLRSESPDLVVPSAVSVPRGRTAVSVPVSAKLVDGPQRDVRLSVVAGGRRLSRTVVVNPGLRFFELVNGSEANDVYPSVRLTGPAPAGGLTVRLRSSDPAVRVPATWHVPSGAYGLTGISPAVGVAPVDVDTPFTVTASLGTRSLSASDVLIPPFDGTQPVVVRLQEEGPLYGGQHWEQLDVSLLNPAGPGGVPVTIDVRDDDPAVALDQTDSFIGEGRHSTSFKVSTAAVTRTTRVVLDVTVGSVTVPYELVVQPGLAGIDLPDPAVSGATLTGTVRIAGPSDVDTTIYLDTSWGILDVQSSVTIPAGETSGSFWMTSAARDTAEDLYVRASLGRTDTYQYLTLTPAR